MLQFDMDDELIGYFSEGEADDIVNKYINEFKKEKMDDSTQQEITSINALYKIAGENPFIKNLIAYYLSLSKEERKEIISLLGWGSLSSKKMIRDFSTAIEKITKQKR